MVWFFAVLVKMKETNVAVAECKNMKTKFLFIKYFKIIITGVWQTGSNVVVWLSFFQKDNYAWTHWVVNEF
jgi:hypothetical protein